MTQAYADLVDQVHWLRGRWRFRHVLDGALLGAAICVAVLLVTAALDQTASFGLFGRAALAFMWWIAIAGSLWRLVLRPASKQPGDDYFAAMVEQQMPDLSNRFINAIQLGRDPAPRAPRLIEAIIADALSALDRVDVTRIATGNRVQRSLMAAVAVAVVLAGYFAIFGPAARTSLARILLPTADIAPYTRTRLSIRPEGHVRVLEGEPLKIDARAEGEVPEEAMLRWVDDQDRKRAVRMEPSGPMFTHAFASVHAPFTFHVTAGDARSRPVEVTVEPLPRIESMNVTYRYPPYAALADRRRDDFDGHLHGLAQTRADLGVHTSKDLESLTMVAESQPPIRFESSDAATFWMGTVVLASNTSYRLKMVDTFGHEVFAPGTYTISAEIDEPPSVRFTAPGRDIQRRPDDSVNFRITAGDDLGLGDVRMLGRVNEGPQPIVIERWSMADGSPQRRAELSLERSIGALNLRPTDRLEYWAVAEDRNDISGPGRSETQRFHIFVLTEEQSLILTSRRLADYARMVSELIRMQRRNHADTAALADGTGLVRQQSVIRRETLRLAALMVKNAFAGRSIIDELDELATGAMARVLTELESYDRARTLEDRKSLASATLADQDEIIERLELILMRLNRNDRLNALLRKKKKKDPAEHQQITASLEKLTADLDKFLLDLKELGEKYEKIAKQKGSDMTEEELKTVEDIEHRLDRWKKWHKDTVDEIARLPEGFVKDSHLRDDLNTIFEEIEKQPRGATKEIATPLEEGAKAGAVIKEDVEMWMPHAGDSLRWVMEEPAEGKFNVPPAELPESLQDMIGDLIEDVAEFDEEADDLTSAWGANFPTVGWDIMDGPISTFSAQGKTGNQLPNSSEITGRSGGGRRGRSSGQMVGSESRALEGRPTPARVTKEPYESGVVDAKKQLDPRGATGGGKKTGGGRRGLQGGTPPGMVADMPRLEKQHRQLRERSQLLARQFRITGQTSWRLQRAAQTMEAAERDLADRRYADAARRRKAALSDLRAVAQGIDEAVSLSLDKARHLPPELRRQISAGAQQPLPKGYEDLIGAYYRVLSAASEQKSE